MTRHDKMLNSIKEFRLQHGLPHNEEPIILPITAIEAHADHFQEELTEYIHATDKVGRIDAAIDLFIFAMGALSHSGYIKNYALDECLGIPNLVLQDSIRIQIGIFTHGGEIIRVELIANWAASIVMNELNTTDLNVFYDLFDIVHASNMSKLCHTKEEAEAKADEYSQDLNYTFRTAKSENGWAIYRNDGKLMKGPHFFAPEAKLAEYINALS